MWWQTMFIAEQLVAGKLIIRNTSQNLYPILNKQFITAERFDRCVPILVIECRKGLNWWKLWPQFLIYGQWFIWNAALFAFQSVFTQLNSCCGPLFLFTLPLLGQLILKKISLLSAIMLQIFCRIEVGSCFLFLCETLNWHNFCHERIGNQITKYEHIDVKCDIFRHEPVPKKGISR